jgi:hypothetical protein
MTSDLQTHAPANWGKIVAAQRQLFDLPTKENATNYKRIVEKTRTSLQWSSTMILKCVNGERPTALQIGQLFIY